MARKRTPKTAAKEKVVSVRMRAETYDHVTSAVEKAGMTRSGYVGSLIENRPVKVEAADMLPIVFGNELKRKAATVSADHEEGLGAALGHADAEAGNLPVIVLSATSSPALSACEGTGR